MNSEIKLELGKYYETRCGEIVRVMAKRGNPRLKFPYGGDNDKKYRSDGRSHSNREFPHDLVRQVTP